MMRRLFIAAVLVCIGTAAVAQKPAVTQKPVVAPKPAVAPKAVLGESAKGMIATEKWEFSNADRDKICTIVFKGDPTAVGFKLEFDPNCVTLFPLVHDVAGWKYPEDDLLYLLDAQGKSLFEFSEVEDGMFEAPTPGLGVLFLQNPAAAAPAAAKKPSDLAGDWVLKRGADTTICTFTLANTVQGDGFAVTIKPGCNPAIANLKFGEWRLVENLLLLVPATGDPWRFEDVDGSWRRLWESTDTMSLERP